MIITKKAISRRTMLRGAGAALALPLLDGMVPALSALGATAAAPCAALWRGLRAERDRDAELAPGHRGSRLRVVADHTAAGAVQGFNCWCCRDSTVRRHPGSGAGPTPCGDEVPDGGASRHLGSARGAHLDGPDRRSGAGASHPARLARAWARGRELCRIVRQRRLQLRLLVHDLLAERLDAVADGARSSGGVRTAVRRLREHGSPGASGAGRIAASSTR